MESELKKLQQRAKELSLTELNISRDTSGIVDLTRIENIETIVEYVMPVIEHNKEWGTGTFTIEQFKANPSLFQTVMDSTLGYKHNCFVCIAKDEKAIPSGLFTTYFASLKKGNYSEEHDFITRVKEVIYNSHSDMRNQVK